MPPISIAIVFTEALWGSPYTYLLPSLWMLCYGCGLVAAGTYAESPKLPHRSFKLVGAAGRAVTKITGTIVSSYNSRASLTVRRSAPFSRLRACTGWRRS